MRQWRRKMREILRRKFHETAKTERLEEYSNSEDSLYKALKMLAGN